MTHTTFDRSTLGFEAAKLLETLQDRADSEGKAQVSTAVLLKESGLAQGSLVRARTELIQKQLLHVEKGYSSSGLRGANVYCLSAVVTARSSAENEGESVQNRADGEDATASSAPSPVREGSETSGEGRRGLLSRLFRRQ